MRFIQICLLTTSILATVTTFLIFAVNEQLIILNFNTLKKPSQQNDNVNKLSDQDIQAGMLRHQPVIFIGGFPRSGTTLMRAILDAHPDVRCGEETRVIPRILSVYTTLNSSKLELNRLNEGGVSSHVLDDAFAAFLSQIIVKHGEPAKRYCNKDPLVMKSATYLSQLYKQSKFIFLIRDGRAVIHSVIKRKVTIAGFDLDDFEQCLSRWNKTVATMWKQCEGLGVKRCLPVWYEMLVQNPRKVAQKVIDFLGLPWNEAVLNHHNHVGKPGGVKLSAFERSSDQVVKPIYTDAVKAFVGHIPIAVATNLSKIAPMIEFFGYQTSRNPDYSKIKLPKNYKAIYQS